MRGRRPPNRRTLDPRLNQRQSRAFSRAMDESFRSGWRSDPGSILLSLAMLAVTYGLIARAIENDQLGLRYVFLPWAFEFVAVMWLGWLLTRTWVREPVFRAISGGVGTARGWSAALVLPYVLLLAWESGFEPAVMQSNFFTAVERWISSGLVWACAAVLVGLLLDTQRDVAAWRRAGGPFVWPATHRFGFRVAALLAMVLFGFFVFWAVLAVCDVFGLDPFPEHAPLAWIGWAFLLGADILMLGLSAFLHRRMTAEETA